MRASYTAFLVCVIVGMSGVIYFDSSRDVISSYLHSIINKFKKCEMHPPLSDEEGYLDNNTWRILWYDIPFYLKKAVTYFEMRVQKCENVSLQCIISTNNSEIMRSNVVVFSASTLPKCPPMKRTSQTWCFNTMENGDFTTWPTDIWENGSCLIAETPTFQDRTVKSSGLTKVMIEIIPTFFERKQSSGFGCQVTVLPCLDARSTSPNCRNTYKSIRLESVDGKCVEFKILT